jgi:RHS repeat-associated protein
LDYNPENRLTLVTSTNATTTFGYADNGSRIWKQTGTNLQVWIGDIYEEKSGQILFHVLANGNAVCTFDSTGTNVFEYYHSDHLRSTSVLTDRSGNRVQHHEYSAFGRDRFTESSTAFSLSRRYTSQILDEETGLYFYGARYYDPELARFIQPDTMIPDFGNPQSFNRYSYTLNNPLKFIDPEGHAPVDWANAMQPGINSYFGSYLGDTAHTSTLGLFSVYMAEGTVGGFNDLLRFGTGIEQGGIDGWSADLQRGGGIVLLAAPVAAKFTPKAAGVEAVVLEGEAAETTPKASVPEVSPTEAAAKTPEQVGITPSEAKRIQNAADRLGKPINVVGSRASGKAKPTSDWDYVIQNMNRKQYNKVKNSLPGAPNRLDGAGRNIDIFDEQLVPDKSYVPFRPKTKQPANTSVPEKNIIK